MLIEPSGTTAFIVRYLTVGLVPVLPTLLVSLIFRDAWEEKARCQPLQIHRESRSLSSAGQTQAQRTCL